MLNLVQRSNVGEFRRRYRWYALFVVLAFGGLTARLFYLQILEGDMHRAQARRNIARERYLATTRGVIRDGLGRVLATNRPSYVVYITPSRIELGRSFDRLCGIVGLEGADRERIEAKIRDAKSAATAPKDGASRDRRAEQQIVMKSDVDRDAVAWLETHEMIGVDVTPTPVRYYPYGTLGAHLIGYLRELDSEMLSRLRDSGYRIGDRLGAVGIERRWESYLRGQRGMRKSLIAQRGNMTRENLEVLEARYLEEPRRTEPIPGRDVSLTIDIDLEASVERAMRGQLAGAVVVLDVRTGRLLAALSKPSFDPNVAAGGGGIQASAAGFQRWNVDPLKPLLDKTISAAYPPGSTYKPFSALAGLADGLIDQNTIVDCRGGFEYGKRFFGCTGVHRRVNLHESIVRSCNTFFYELGVRISIDRLASIGLDYGFGAKTGIGVNPEAKGRMPTRAWYTRHYGQAFRGGFSVLSSIGQGAMTVSVLQLALAYAAVANGGTLYQPQVVRSIETSDGTIVQDFPPRVRRIIGADTEHVGLVRGGLAGVVSESEGTAHKEGDGVDMAGKTGTAQVTQVTPRGSDPDSVWYFNRAHAWFAGYAPAEAPEIAIVVIVEHGGGGGKAAAPIAARVVREWQNLKQQRLVGSTNRPASNAATF